MLKNYIDTERFRRQLKDFDNELRLTEGDEYAMVSAPLWDFLYTIYNCDYPIKIKYYKQNLLSSHRSQRSE